MTARPDPALRVAMFAPWHERCGIRDYSALLVSAMETLSEIDSLRIVDAPSDAARTGIASVLRRHRHDAMRFKQLGRAMNSAAEIAHIQHQYFLFGGVAPYRSHVTSFLSEITVPAVVTVHEIAEEGVGSLKRMVVRAANRMNFSHPAIRALIVHTEADRNSLLRMGLPERRLHVIRFPAPPALPMPDAVSARSALAATYPQVTGRSILTLFGFLSNKKGHRIALDALLRLPEDIALIFAGDRHPDDHTGYVSSLRADIERLGLASRVVITGYLPEDRIPEIMAGADVALAPYLRTSGSGSLANLLAYGRAVVASDIEPHRELLGAEPGLLSLVPTEDAESLAAEALALLNDPPRRERLQRAALDYAARNTYLEFARQTVKVYREVLDQG